jgi:hypothetical protein
LIVSFIGHFGVFVPIQSLFLYIAFAINDTWSCASLKAYNFAVILNLDGFVACDCISYFKLFR